MKFICLNRHDREQASVGDSIEQAWNSWKDIHDAGDELDDVEFYEFGPQLEVKVEYVATPKVVKANKLPKG